MHELINSLDDAKAIRILRTVARGMDLQPRSQLTPETRQALRETFELPSGSEPPSEGALARLALTLLSEDPSTRPAISALISGPAPESFDGGATIAIATLALMALQTRVQFTRDAKGKTTLLIDKKAASDAILKQFIQKLLSYLP